jgi:hypothetical protein
MNGRREHLWRQIQCQNAPTALSALDALDAAFLLFSFGQLAQAVFLFLFHHSIELAMKGFLESLHIILTADRLDYELLKWIARERIQKHPLAHSIQFRDDPSSSDPKKTCNFEETLRRVDEILVLPKELTGVLIELNNLRNKIVHFGDKDLDELDCATAILKQAWPFLKHFYARAYVADISMILRTEEQA